MQRSSAEERELAIWAAGWDAAVSWLFPMYQLEHAEADRYYRAAYCPSEKPKWGRSHREQQTLVRELQEQRAREWKGEA